MLIVNDFEKGKISSSGRNIYQKFHVAEFHIWDTNDQRTREEQNTEDKDFKNSGAENRKYSFFLPPPRSKDY